MSAAAPMTILDAVQQIARERAHEGEGVSLNLQARRQMLALMVDALGDQAPLGREALRRLVVLLHGAERFAESQAKELRELAAWCDEQKAAAALELSKLAASEGGKSP